MSQNQNVGLGMGSTTTANAAMAATSTAAAPHTTAYIREPRKLSPMPASFQAVTRLSHSAKPFGVQSALPLYEPTGVSAFTTSRYRGTSQSTTQPHDEEIAEGLSHGCHSLSDGSGQRGDVSGSCLRRYSHEEATTMTDRTRAIAEP